MENNTTWDLITSNYSDYYTQYPDESLINIEFPNQSVDYPLKYALNNGIEIVIDSIEEGIDTQYLLQLNPELPDFEDLSDEVMSNIPVELTKIAQIKVTEDHREYWKETYRRAESYFGSSDEYDNFLDLLKIVTVLACWRTTNSKNDDSGFIRDNSYLIVSYLLFPLLESLAAGLCSEDIDPITSEVREGRRVRKLCQDVEYYTEEDVVSDIGALLYHIESEVGNDDIEDSLIEMRESMSEFGDKEKHEAYGMLKSWRNELLHGAKKPIGQFVIVMNLLSLILWKAMMYPGESFRNHQ